MEKKHYDAAWEGKHTYICLAALCLEHDALSFFVFIYRDRAAGGSGLGALARADYQV